MGAIVKRRLYSAIFASLLLSSAGHAADVIAPGGVVTFGDEFFERVNGRVLLRVPEALESLTTDILTVSGGVLRSGGGSLANNIFSVSGFYGDRGVAPPVWWEVIRGSQASPVTVGGAMVALGQIVAIPPANCDNVTANTGCNSTLVVQSMATSASTMVNSAFNAYAETQSTSGLGIGNAQAGNFVARAGSGSTAAGLAIYAEGRRNGVNGKALAGEFTSWNNTNTDCPAVNYAGLSHCVGIYIAPRGEAGGTGKLSSAAIQIIQSADTSKYREGIVFNQDVISGKTFNDQSSAPISINVGGLHTTALLIEEGAGRVVIGADQSYLGPAATTYKLQMYGQTQIAKFGDDASAATLAFSKSRHATIGSHTTLQSGDIVGTVLAGGSDGTDYVSNSRISMLVEGAVSTGIVPGAIVFSTMNASGGLGEAVRITSSRMLTFGGITNAVPALDPNGTTLRVRLGDNSGYAPIAASAYSVGATAGASCTVGTLNPATAVVTNGIITTC